MSTLDNAQVYVACLASYNAGKLHGRWIEVSSDPDEMAESVAEMLADSPEAGAEEYAIHDTEDCEGLDIGEFSSLAEIAARFEFIEDCHDPDLAVACLELSSDLDDARNYLDRCIGSADSFREWADEQADQMIEESGASEILTRYFDYDAWARDLEIEYTTGTVNGTVFVFTA